MTLPSLPSRKFSRGALSADAVAGFCCLWRPAKDDPDTGMCFDFLESDLYDLRGLVDDLINHYEGKCGDGGQL